MLTIFRVKYRIFVTILSIFERLIVLHNFMFSQQKPKRFNYASKNSVENDQRKSDVRQEFQDLKRRPKKNNTKVSTLIVLLGLLIVVFMVMYYLEAKMN